MQENSFLQSLMVLPVKPSFIGFTIDTDTLFRQLVPVMNEIIGHDVSDLCHWSYNDEDYELYFRLDSDSLESLLGEEEYLRVWNSLPFDLDSPWEVCQHLLSELYKVGNDSWAYATVRSWDQNQAEVQIGIPRNL